MENGNQPALPIKPYKELVDDFANNWAAWGGINPMGLTKREYFAAKALQGLLTIYSEGQEAIVPNQDNVIYMACLAVKAADELLCALDEIEAKPVL